MFSFQVYSAYYTCRCTCTCSYIVYVQCTYTMYMYSLHSKMIVQSCVHVDVHVYMCTCRCTCTCSYIVYVQCTYTMYMYSLHSKMIHVHDAYMYMMRTCTCTLYMYNVPSHSFPPPSVSPLRRVNDVFCTSPGLSVSVLAAILWSPLVHLTTDTEYSDDTSPVLPTSTVSAP